MSENDKNNNDSDRVANALTFTGAVLGSGAGPLGAVVGATIGRILATVTNPSENNE